MPRQELAIAVSGSRHQQRSIGPSLKHLEGRGCAGRCQEIPHPAIDLQQAEGILLRAEVQIFEDEQEIAWPHIRVEKSRTPSV